MLKAGARVILIGPDRRGIGGIESVLRAYGQLGVPEYEFEYLTTWNKTVAEPKNIFPWSGALIALVRNATRWRRSKTLIHVHLSHKGSFVREGFFLALSRMLGLSTFATIHGSAFVATASDSRIWRVVYKVTLSFANRVSVLNTRAFGVVTDLGQSNVMVMNNPGPVAERRTYGLAGDCRPVAVFAGSVGRRKGVDVLLEAWEIVRTKVPEAELVIFGPAEDTDVVNRAGSYWQGTMDSEDLLEVIASSRVAVLPSTAEAMPMFVIEAMGCRRPLVVTDVGAMASMAKNCGIVVDIGDAKGCSPRLVGYLVDSEKASKDGLRAGYEYESMYGTRTIKASLDKFFETVLVSEECK